MQGRILLTATGSGSGKTTVTMALIKALSMKGLKVVSYKCGPDYIDPMYHRQTLGIPAYNLDPFFCPKDELCEILQRSLLGKDIGVMEGVMGYYDGIGLEGNFGTREVAMETQTPAILILDAKGMSNSVGAVLHGFKNYKGDSQLKGVIFNKVSKGMYPLLSEIAKEEGFLPLGYMPYNPAISLESRYLGLVTAKETEGISKKIRMLGEMALENLDTEGIIALANTAGKIKHQEALKQELPTGKKVKLAVARDEAFCFLYEENLDMLSEMGCEILFFSPISDESLPSECDGLYLPGGYPELYKERLSENVQMRSSVKKAVENGLPTIAECGGFLYLHESLEGVPFVGVIGGAATKQEKLVRFGYGTMEAKSNGLLLKKGDSIRIHEFHYYDSEQNGNDFEITKASNGKKYECAYSTDTLYAGYPHLYFRANKEVAKNFVGAMRTYRGLE